MFKTAVAGSSRSVVALAGNHHVKALARMLLFEGFQHLQGVVGAVVIHQHHLQGAVGLGNNAVQCLADDGGAVIDGYDDADFHKSV